MVIDVGTDGQVEALAAEVAQLRTALVTRTTIGRASGLLAQRYSITNDQGWAVLRDVSNHGNVRLVAVAEVLVAVHDGHLDEHADRAAVVALATVLDTAVERVRRRAG